MRRLRTASRSGAHGESMASVGSSASKWRRLGRPAALTTLALWLCAGPAGAQLPAPRLDRLWPPGAQAGSEVTITLQGRDLAGATALVWEPPLLSAERIDEGKFRLKFQPEAREAGGALPRVVQVRALTPLGASNSRLFAIGSHPEVICPEGHHEPKEALPVEVPCTVQGHVDQARRDVFTFKAKAGERWLLRCLARQIDSALDAGVVVRAEDGRELAASRGGADRDPLMPFAAPADGRYFVEVFDVTFGGGEDHFYRLTITQEPEVLAVLPPVLNAGDETPVTVLGWNLPGGVSAGLPTAEPGFEQVQVSVTAPAGGPDVPIGRRIFGPPMRSLPVFGGITTADFAIGDRPLRQISPAEAPAGPLRLDLPAKVSGLLGDGQWFEFTGRGGATWWIEVASSQFGCPADPAVLLQRVSMDGEGRESVQVIAQGDDQRVEFGRARLDVSSKDPLLKVTLPEDGTYRLLVADRSGSSSPRPFVLSIREAEPDFSLAALVESPRNSEQEIERMSAMLRPGGAAVISVAALRRDGFDEPMEVTVNGLPAGVTCERGLLIPETNETAVVLRAAADAPPGHAFAAVVGRASGREKLAQVLDLRRDVKNQRFQRVDPRVVGGGLAVSVVPAEPLPLTITATGERLLSTALGGEIELPFHIKKGGERLVALEELQVEVIGLPGLRKSPKAGAGEGDGKLALRLRSADGNHFRPGTHTFYVAARGRARWKVDGEEAPREIWLWNVSEPLTLNLEEAPFALNVPQMEGTVGAEWQVPLTLERQFGFEGPVEVVLSLAGNALPPLKLEPGQVQLQVPLAVPAGVPPGAHELVAVAKARWNEQDVSRRTTSQALVRPGPSGAAEAPGADEH